MRSIISALLLFVIAGCSSGLSPRESRTQNYSAFVLSLYENPAPADPTPTIVAPMKLAVAQVGEMTPPQAMLARLRQKPNLFARVEGIPGVFEEAQSTQNLGALSDAERRQIRERVARLQRMTRDLGMDYLFLYGGSLEHFVRENPLQVLDWTIVGAYIVPSRQVRATGKAAGALIDTHNGSVILIASADTDKSGLASMSNQGGETFKVLLNTRDSLNMRLADQLIVRCGEVALTRPE